MSFKIQFTDLKRQYKELEEEIVASLKKIMESARFINGPEVTELEEKIAKYCGCKIAVGVGSGTDALLLSLMALDIKKGDEVITTPFTFIATAEVISLLGARPVFVDIDQSTYNIDAAGIKARVTDKTKAIIPVHLYGQTADMDEINKIAKEHDLFVIEDACQAIGAEYKGKKAGSLGHAGAFSFFPAKNLGAYGDGGMVTTDDEDLAAKIKTLREHGSKERYRHSLIGINARLDTMQAAVLLIKLKKLDQWLQNRIKLASRYSEKLKDLVHTPVVRKENKAVFNQYTILTDRRDDLIKFLNDNGIPTAIHYPMPLHLQKAFEFLGYKQGDFPVSEEISKKVMSLPMYPEMTEQEQDLVINEIHRFFKK
ncbi:MAG: DegT/DnrJ/EryC1/StrS family aminotransferase [Spirochaetes bacterium]|nr:DegT/DnrJ/EryC1/StrS family aminotransferase [Spirochaetota bacterium]